MPQGSVGEEKPRGRPFLTIRTKLAVYFSLMAVAILIAIQLTNIVGVPFTEAFRRLEVVAVLCAAVSANDMIRPMLYTGAGLGERGEVLLINQDVRSLLSLKHPLADGTVAEPLEYQIQAQPAVRAASGQEGIIEDEDYRREPVLAAYRYIPVTAEWGWGMVVKRDREELFAPLRLSLTYSSAIGLLGILALVVLTAWLASRLSRPILALSQTAVQVAQGDFDARAPVTTTDEVGYLARTFNTMLQRIEERTEELATLNKELEAFSYSISHDLQTPLRAIDGFSRILVERHADKLDVEGTRLLGIIRSNTQQMGTADSRPSCLRSPGAYGL